jgi:hypothetical protein
MPDGCCDEHGCTRKQPMLLRPGTWSDGWYVVTKYTRKGRDGQADLIRAETKHRLDDEASAALNRWREADAFLAELLALRDGPGKDTARAAVEDAVWDRVRDLFAAAVPADEAARAGR